MTTETLTAIFAVINSIVIAAVSYGVLKEKIVRVEKELDTVKSNTVSIALLDAIINPLKDDLRELKRDIKHLVDAVDK